MKDFRVMMVRREEILIRAESALDAASMATCFREDSWDDKFELYVEEADSKADQGGETLKLPTIPTKAGKKQKKKNWRWKCRCNDHSKDADIPF